MADLLTHYVSARLPGGFIGDDRARLTLALGVFMPDLISKAIEWIPWTPYLAGAPSHSFLGVACTSLAVAMLFSEDFRFKAFVTLLAGQLLHVGADAAKDAQGFGSVFLLLPFSLEGYESGLYSTQDVFWFLPANVAVLFALRLIARRARERGWVWR